MSETFARQWAMLKMIPKHPRTIDSVILRDRLRDQGLGTTSLRTIQRDLEMLSLSFPLGIIDPGKRPIQWHWMSGAALDIPALDPSEAVAMKLVQSYLTPMLPGAMLKALEPHFESAERVLKQAGALGPGRWTQRIRVLPKGLQLLAPKVDADAQNAVYDSLLRERRLAIAYRPHGQAADKAYRINPLGLVIRNNVVYLVASLAENNELRQFVLHRMNSARTLDEAAIVPHGFDLDQYIAEGEFGWPTGKKIRLIANFSRGAALSLAETPLCSDQTMRELNEDEVRVTATVLETEELHWWLMSFGAEVEVLGPRRLRASMSDSAKAMMDIYGNCKRST